MIKATFIDEISHDIPHQNWGTTEWDKDFNHMKTMGIDTVVLIRCGYKQWLTYPSKYLQKEEGCFKPEVDLVELFLQLCDKYEIEFFFGLYDSGKYWVNNNYAKELEINKEVITEVWEQYGHHKAFKGWYLTHEISRLNKHVVNLYAALGAFGKSKSNTLNTLLSPYIDGVKNISQYTQDVSKEERVSLNQHQEDWNYIFSKIKDSVDIVAFQDGHVSFEELTDFMLVNKQLADKYNIESWTNTESFDRDMPIKFLPIKWDKLRLKLEAAKKVGIEKAITFEFSHFMSPQSAYIQAHHLYNRYLEYIKAK